MSLFGWITVIILLIAVLSCPRKYAPVVLLIGCILLTPNQSVVLAGLRFKALRILILTGLLRVYLRKEQTQKMGTPLDKLVLGFMLWSVFISFFQPFEEGSGPVYAIGNIINTGGTYYLLRAWISDFKDIRFIIGAMALMLVPLAGEMFYENRTGVNLFSYLTDISRNSIVREGKIRANGSFAHPILAGTVGAVCFPLIVGIFGERRPRALIGLAAAFLVTLTSRSSGPMMSLLISIGFLCLWKLRHYYKAMFFSAVAGYIVLDIIMTPPAYHLMARIDLSGGSTGAHRVYLLDSFFRYFNEWWLAGTNYTRHWMTTGVSYTDQHTDITSYYIATGINGGLVALLIFLAILFSAIRTAPTYASRNNFASTPDAFLVWCLGSGMAAHAATSISVSYFDQSVYFFWLNLALLGAAQATITKAVDQTEPQSSSIS